MTEKTYQTRGGSAAFLLGAGPLTKTFLQFEVDGVRHLVWEKTLRYRMDNHKDGSPVEHPLDILEIEE